MKVWSPSDDGLGFQREFCGYDCSDVPCRFRHYRIRSLEDEVRRIRRWQPCLHCDPTRPRTPLAQCFFWSVVSRMTNEVLATSTRMIMTIGFKMDDLRKVDCVLENGVRIATIDLTVRPFKSRFNARFLLTREHFVTDKYHEVAELVARHLS
jgi:hypothetical protein